MSSEGECSRVQDLPAEIRAQIWQALPYEDRLNLRLTSKFTKDDVDTVVGLNGRITTANKEKYDFYRRVALSSCWITELQQPINQYFFLNPSALQALDILEYAPIPLQNIWAILQVTTNLRRLELRMILTDNSRGISETVLECLPNMKDLKHLHLRTIKYYYVDIVKNYGRATSSHSYSLNSPKSMKTIHLEMPDLPDNEVAKWKMVLDKQTSIETLTINLGNLCWRFYERILGQNSGSIQKLVLHGLHGWNDQRVVEDPMDWSIFAELSQLKSISLSCSRRSEREELPTFNFQLFPCAGLEEFFTSRLALSSEAVERVHNHMTNLKQVSLNHIGNLGSQRVNEMAAPIHDGAPQSRRWWQGERFWEVLVHSLFGISLVLALRINQG